MDSAYLKTALLLGLISLSLVASLPYAYATDPNVLYPVDDSYVDEATPSTNYGSDVNLKVYYHKTSTDHRYAYIKFNITLYEYFEPGCKLRVYANDVRESSDNYYLKKVVDDTWNESLVTWSNKPDLGSTLYSQSCGFVGWKEFDVTTYLQDARDDGRDYVSFGFSFEAIPMYTFGNIDFDAKEGTNDPELVVYGVEGGGAVSYDLYGAIDKDGYRDGAINCTLYRHYGSPRKAMVDGWTNITEGQSQIAWKFDLGYNVSRTYYCLPDNESETIYVVRPTEPYYIYFFSIVDYVGVEDAFLETLLNINGLDTVVERWRIDMLNELPFTLSWGTAYKLRLRCDRGTYYYPEFVATGSADVMLAVTSEMFPDVPTDIGELVVSATRVNMSHVRAVYLDASAETDWVWMGVYEVGGASVLSSTNVSDYSLTWNWYEADDETDYYVKVIVQHQRRGLLTWVKLCPAPYESDNPWSGLDGILGTNFLISPSQLPGLGILVLFFACFSGKNAGLGLIIGGITAMFLTYIGWIDFSWEWLIGSLAVGFIIAFSIEKERTRTV